MAKTKGIHKGMKKLAQANSILKPQRPLPGKKKSSGMRPAGSMINC